MKCLLLLLLMLSSVATAKVKTKGTILMLTDQDSAAILASTVNIVKTDIYLTINSPGGNLIPYKQLGNSLRNHKEKGFKVFCYIIKASSMAFYIATVCSKRYIVTGAKMMTHRIVAYCKGRCKYTVKMAKILLKNDKWFHDEINKVFKPANYVYLIDNEVYMTKPYLDRIAPGFIDGEIKFAK